jgi:NAD(P)-dependent dehydrogenase (short-subunit alcohol dehydrogenase family)
VAGVSQGDSIERIRDQDWDASMAVNVTAPMRLTRALLPALERTPHAAVVYVASAVAVVGARKISYAASKAALFGLTRALTKDLGKRGIRINTVIPAATLTPMTEDWDEQKRAAVAASSPLNRIAQPEEIAAAIAFLLGTESSYITGTALDVTGGRLLGSHA